MRLSTDAGPCRRQAAGHARRRGGARPLRLALGALEGQVLLQFLIEAVLLSALGGVVGIAVATGASWALSGAVGRCRA